MKKAREQGCVFKTSTLYIPKASTPAYPTATTLEDKPMGSLSDKRYDTSSGGGGDGGQINR